MFYHGRRYTRRVDAARVRRWVADKREVEAREHAERRSAGVSSQEAISQALALVALYGRLHGWPAREDEVSTREDAQMYDRWHRLKTIAGRVR